VAAHRELAPAAEREPVDRGDRGLGRRLELPEDLLPLARQPLGVQRRGAPDLADVGAGDERAPGAGEDHARHVVAARHLVHGRPQLGDELVVEAR
jgi:hypothetical protein